MANYTYKYQKEKKINSTTTRMANVTVFEKGKVIGNECVAKYHSVEDVVSIIIRDNEMRKMWSKFRK
jgi:hypothetical protein